MPTRTANAQWNGTLKGGKGTIHMASGAWEGPYSFGSRFEEGAGTNPEELLAAAHAGCFSMALSAGLEGAGFPANSVATTAKVTVEPDSGGFSITKVRLETQADVPGIDDAKFQEVVEGTKNGCPVSKLFKGAQIEADAKLVGGASG